MGLGLADNPVVLLINVAIGRLDAGMLVRTIGLVVCRQAQREVQIIRCACHDGTAVATVCKVHHLRHNIERNRISAMMAGVCALCSAAEMLA